MDEKKEAKKLAMTNTKQEMLDAYSALLKQLQEKQDRELRPEKKMEEKKTKEAVAVAESLGSENVAKEINNLKLDVNKMLTQLYDRLDSEVNIFMLIQNAIAAKEREIQELYEIEKSAMTLAALIEAQNQKRQEFMAEMDAKKEALKREIETTRDEWEKEKEICETTVKERDAADKKRQTREKEEFDYNFKREQQIATDRYKYEKAKIEQELKDKKETLENEMKAREAAIAEREEELADLRKRAAQFPKELETAVNRAVKETTERITFEAKAREDLLKKESEGERNVFKARIESLEKTVKEQNDRMARLSQQLEEAYQKVQDIAVKTVEGASNAKSLSNLQQLLGDQMRKQGQEK
jgi:hypothetical protein